MFIDYSIHIPVYIQGVVWITPENLIGHPVAAGLRSGTFGNSMTPIPQWAPNITSFLIRPWLETGLKT